MSNWNAKLGIAFCAIIATLLWSALSVASVAAPPAQRGFASPEKAVEALVAAARAERPAELERIFGPAGRKLISSGDPVADKAGRARFVAAYDAMSKIEREDDGKAVLVVGKDNWPMPIPLVQHDGAWYFDTKAGAEEILDRRIGRNELAAIEVCRAFVDAERDYAARDRLGDGIREYARKFASSPGKRDGLYWPAGADGETSPMGPLIVAARAEGYGAGLGAPYHGYYYKILTRQGAHAPGGAYDYVVKDHMIGGFALVAFPARFGDSGVMTFIVNQDGVVYQKNLGSRTASLARAMTRYDPDDSWRKAP